MGKLRVTYEGSNREAAEAVLNFAVQSSNIVRGMKQQLGIDRITKVFEAPDGAQVYVLDYEYLRRVHIVPAVEVSESTVFDDAMGFGGFDEVGIPDFVSGAVTSKIIDLEAIHLPGDSPDAEPMPRPVVRKVQITERTADRIPLDMARHKLAIEEHAVFAPLSSDDPYTYSQHRSLKPGRYTGAMRPLMQILLGLGRVRPETYEQRWLREGEDRALLMADDVLDDDGVPQPSAFGLFQNEGDEPFEAQLTYDYRWNRTHGISWGADGRAYVVEIGQRGVLVMPLLVDLVSTTEAGRERYEALFPELFDTGLMVEYGDRPFFDLFGGFPTGSPPPMGAAQLDRWVRAGEVIKAIDQDGMGPAYAGKIPYSTAMGWAFHPNGREAHNTCYGYDGRGIKVGFHYAVTISIGAVEERDPPAAALEVIEWLGLRGIDRRKALRMDEAQAKEILAIDGADAARETLAAMTVRPEVQVSASLRLQKQGPLFHPAPLVPGPGVGGVGSGMGGHPLIPGVGGGAGGGDGFSGQPQLKVAEPLFGGALVSFDFGADDVDAENGPRCDTPVFVCYRGSTLTTINYTWHYQRPGQPEDIDTRQPCQLEGVWQTGQNSEGATTHGNFYTTDIDWREDINAAGGMLVTTSSSPVGRTTMLSFCAFFAVHGTAYNEYWYVHTTTMRSSGARSRNISVAIPDNERSIYLIAKLDSEDDIRVSTSVGAPMVGATGSGRARGALYDFTMHWSGACRDDSVKDDGELTCVMREYGRPYQVESCISDTAQLPAYAPCGSGEFVLNKRFGTVPAGEGSAQNADPDRNLSYEIRMYGDTPIAGRVTAKNAVSGKDPGGAGGLVDFYSLGMSSWWWRPSPDRNGAFAYLRVNTNRFGSPLIGYEPDFDANAEFVGEPEMMHVDLNACYVGWVA